MKLRQFRKCINRIDHHKFLYGHWPAYMSKIMSVGIGDGQIVYCGKVEARYSEQSDGKFKKKITINNKKVKHEVWD